MHSSLKILFGQELNLSISLLSTHDPLVLLLPCTSLEEVPCLPSPQPDGPAFKSSQPGAPLTATARHLKSLMLHQCSLVCCVGADSLLPIPHYLLNSILMNLRLVVDIAQYK